MRGPPPTVRSTELAVTTLQRCLEFRRGAEHVLAATLRRHPDLAGDERGWISFHVLATVCLLGRLRCLVPSSHVDDARWLLAAHLLHEDGVAPSLLSSVDDATLRAHAPCWPTDEPAALAAHLSLPPWLVAAWLPQLGNAALTDLASVLNRPGPMVLRANLLKNGRDALLSRLRDGGVPVEPTLLSPWGIRVLSRFNAFGSPEWRDGAFEVQDEGSQLLALACAARPGETVVDACAGAGGKTLALAAMMGDRGNLVVMDPDAQRMANLHARARRAGVTMIRQVPHLTDEPLAADLVLVDAPCSATGTLRRGPSSRWMITPGLVSESAELQRQLLARAAAWVRPGGRLVYATCSLADAENAGVAAWFAGQFGHFLPRPLDHLPVPRGEHDEAHTRTLWPHVHGTDGFFVAAFQRAR